MNEPVLGRMQASLVQGGTDTSQELFGIVDSIQGGFAASLDDAKAEQKAAQPQEKLAGEEPEAAAEDMEANAAVSLGRQQSTEPLKIPELSETARQLAEGGGNTPHKQSVLQQMAPTLRQALTQQGPPAPQADTAAPTEAVAQTASTEATPAPAEPAVASETTEPQTPVLTLSSKESAQILQNLQNISSATQVQPPNPTTLSTPILEALKGSNPQLARSVETARPTGALAAVERAKTADKVAKAQKAVETKPHSRLEDLKQKVVDQVRHQMRLALRGSAQEVRMALRPGFLGNVKIRMLMEKSSLTASFVVENQTVRELLQRSADQLQELLADSGLDLETLEIQVADDALSGDGKQHASSEGREAINEWFGSVYRWEADNTEEGAAAGDSPTDPEAGLDLIV